MALHGHGPRSMMKAEWIVREAVHGYECTVDIPKPVLESAIAALELYVQHPGTGALHDPLYGLLRGGRPQAREELAEALSAHTGHPAASTLRELLSEHLELPALSLEVIVVRHGADPERDALAEAERLLTDAATTRRVLSGRVESLEAQTAALSRTANGMAAVGALVAVFGMIGWLIALGWLEVSWIEPPVPERPEDAAAGRGTAGPTEQRKR